MSSFAAICFIIVTIPGTLFLVSFFLIHLCYWLINDTEDSEERGEAIEMKPIGRDVGKDHEQMVVLRGIGVV